MLVASCSRGTEIDQVKLRSAAREALSVANDASLLAERAAEGLLTDNYRRGHAAYLDRQLEDLAAELGSASAPPRLETDLDTLREQVRSSRATIEAMSTGPGADFEQAKAALDHAAAALRPLAALP